MKSIEEIEKSIQKKFRKELFTPFIHALKEFDMVNEGDKIAVAVSGGKDSLLLSKLFQELKRISDVNFEVFFISMNPGFSIINLENMKKNLVGMGIDCEIYDDNVFEIAKKMSDLRNSKKPCYMCARLRRGSLYTKATSLGCNKLALGHHLDDVVETTLMSMLYMGKFETMLPKLKADNFDIELIRPLFYVEEKNIKRFMKYNEIYAMNCGCEVASGLIESKRREIKELIASFELKDKDIKKRIMQSVFNVNIEKILGFKYKKENISVYDNYTIIKNKEDY